MQQLWSVPLRILSLQKLLIHVEFSVSLKNTILIPLYIHIQIFALLSSFLPGDLDPQGIRRAVITQDGPESRYTRAGLDIVQKSLHPVEELVLCGVTGGCPVPPALKLQGPTGPVYHPMQMKGPSTGFKCNDVTTPA